MPPMSALMTSSARTFSIVASAEMGARAAWSIQSTAVQGTVRAPCSALSGSLSSSQPLKRYECAMRKRSRVFISHPGRRYCPRGE
jgi:hypothetical protein